MTTDETTGAAAPEDTAGFGLWDDIKPLVLGSGATVSVSSGGGTKPNAGKDGAQQAAGPGGTNGGSGVTSGGITIRF